MHCFNFLLDRCRDNFSSVETEGVIGLKMPYIKETIKANKFCIEFIEIEKKLYVMPEICKELPNAFKFK